MPKINEPSPPDPEKFRRVMRQLYEEHSHPLGSHGRRLSMAQVSHLCEKEGSWLSHATSSAVGIGNVRTDDLVKFANFMGLDPRERRRLARAAGRGATDLLQNPIEVSRRPSMSMRHAILLSRADRPREAEERIYRTASASTGFSVRMTRVLGAYDVILRLSAPRGSQVLELMDRIRATGMFGTTDTLLLRDDLRTVRRGLSDVESLHQGKASAARSRYRNAAYVLFETDTDLRHDDLIDSVIEGQSSPGVALLTAAVLLGRFDAVAEVTFERFEHLDSYLLAVKRGLSPSPTTVTFPAISPFMEIGQSW